MTFQGQSTYFISNKAIISGERQMNEYNDPLDLLDDDGDGTI